MRILPALGLAIACVSSGCEGGPQGPSDSTAVARIVLNPGTVALTVSGTQPLEAQAFSADDARLEGVSFHWGTSDAAVATVNTAGVVTAVGTGTAEISASANSVTGRAEVVVMPAAVQGQTIAVLSNVTYQTMSGWEATAFIGQLECDATAYQIYAPQVLDRAVNEVGLNRVRLQIQSGIENPVDYFTPFASGTISRDAWKQHWYEAINDNSDPGSINPAGFQFARLDSDVQRVVEPLRQRLAARGEKLYVNLTYVDFATSPFEHTSNVQEYAELVLATFQHLNSKYGWTPDAVEISLEPDNTPNWRAPVIGNAIVAAGDRLKAAGFHPDFIAPSNTDASRAVTYFDQLVQTPRVKEYLTDLAYHRYGGASAATIQAIGARATQHGVRTSMLEHIGSGYAHLHEDLKIGRNSAWEQYAIAGCAPGDPGGRHYLIDPSVPSNPKITIASRTKLLRQYFLFVRFGAVRIGAVSGDPRLDPLAFRNTNGKLVVIVKTTAAGNFSVQGLAAGTYGIKYATAGAWDVDLPDATIAAGEEVNAAIPAAGVISIYQR
jgi:hypothetical protein